MSAPSTVEELVKRNVIIAITGLVYAVPTFAILVSELGKPDRSYFSMIMTIGLASVPQGWPVVKEMSGVNLSVGINKLEDIGVNILLFFIKIFLIIAFSALISPFIFIKNLIEFITNCGEIGKAKKQPGPTNKNEDRPGGQSVAADCRPDGENDGSRKHEPQPERGDRPPRFAPEIVWNNRVDEFYLTRANVYRFCSLAAIFAFVKWMIGADADMALLWAFVGSTLVFGLFLNRVRNIAASDIFLFLAFGYYFKLGPIVEKATGIALLNPLGQTGSLASLIWLAVASALLGASFLIGKSFFDRQMPPPLHRAALYCLLVVGNTITYSWPLIALSCFFTGLKPLCAIVVIAVFIVSLFRSAKPAEDISWDLSVARNSTVLNLDEDTKAIVDALPNALNSPNNIPPLLTLATKYAQCDGIMRNARQCIRWSEAILDFLEGSSPEAGIRNAQTCDMERHLAHMLLYIVYERSEKHRSPSKAMKHRNAFDRNVIDISEYWCYWSDPNCPFEDHGDTRYFGLPFSRVLKAAESDPDAYRTLFDYCMKFSRDRENADLCDLAVEYLQKGVALNSPACQRKVHMLNLARDVQDIEGNAAEGTK